MTAWFFFYFDIEIFINFVSVFMLRVFVVNGVGASVSPWLLPADLFNVNFGLLMNNEQENHIYFMLP